MIIDEKQAVDILAVLCGKVSFQKKCGNGCSKYSSCPLNFASKDRVAEFQTDFSNLTN